ncbi:MAG: hypothetical protein PVJ67_06875 [Candidatus Pacearchaeota archaeon]|jgi:hypothetical protein
MENSNYALEIRPKRFVLTSHLLDESLPKKIKWFKELAKDKRESFVQSSFSKTGLCPFSLLPSLIKSKWVFEESPERYFRLDKENNLLYVCVRNRKNQEVAISGYDLSYRENFKLKDFVH